MNLHKKIAFTTVLVAILAFSGTPSAMASTSGHDRSAFNSSAEVALQEKLSNIASTNNLDVEFGEFKIDAPQSTIDEYHGDANLYAESIAKAYEEDTASNTRETKNASTRGTRNIYLKRLFWSPSRRSLLGKARFSSYSNELQSYLKILAWKLIPDRGLCFPMVSKLFLV